MDVSFYMMPCMADLNGAREDAFVVIDALRMTSTALQNGAGKLLAVGQVQEALDYREGHDDVLLGGERKGVLIESFDLDNSPLAYTRQRVKGKTIVMTTTNGTRAIASAANARRLLLGAYINARAVAKAIENEKTVSILCAGTGTHFSMEDVVAGGAILARLQESRVPLRLDDAAQAAMKLYELAQPDIHGMLSTTRHYNVMKAGGQQADIDYCLKEDVIDAVPERCADGFFRLKR